MNEEQINEAMRLGELWATYAWKACSHGADETVKSQAGRAALKAYLRTIGEPENTFPLNPNGASKWAHLQKHDGAEAIGVVFRTGSGSVGSLVDGRVVWADWLAHPNGSKSADSEYTDEDMAAVGRALMAAITQYAPKGWSPADCPSELVGDLHNECEELRSDAERYRKLRDVHGVAETQNVEHNSGSAMNEFQSMFLTEPQPINSAAFLLAEEYNARCEAYDQKVCTGPTTRDGIQPADGRELGLISRNAIAVLADVTIKALDQGVTVDELRQAISKLP